jgi:transposase
MTNQKSLDYKNTAVEYYLVEDTTQEEVCRIFKCSRRSLMRWVKQYETKDEITGYKRKPIAYKVHKEHIDFLLQEIKRNKTITSNDLQILLMSIVPAVAPGGQHVFLGYIFYYHK